MRALPGHASESAVETVEFGLTEAIAILSRTSATPEALPRGLPEIRVRCNERKDTRSAFDIVG